MKVALLVFPIHYSHGCILQTYALYSQLKELGHDVTILDRQPDAPSVLSWSLSVAKRIAKYIFKGYRGGVFYRGGYPRMIMKEQQSFIDHFKKDITTVYSTEELRQIVITGGFEAIVVGSDQTWRPCYVQNVMDYWLEFASDIPIIRVAYAPSFGVDKWEYDENQTARCKKLACLFNGISVREQSGVKLCKEYLNVEAKHVLDPTMLWDKKFYTSIANKSPVKEYGCQCYFLDRTPEKEAIAQKIADTKHLKVNYINTRSEDHNAPVKERIATGIEKWLAGFMNGDFIVVDSFHAMVFSIIFEKPFLVIGNKRRGMSRFESLLGELGLNERMINSDEDLEDVLNKDIKWEEVREKISRHRDLSIDYVLKSLTI